MSERTAWHRAWQDAEVGRLRVPSRAPTRAEAEPPSAPTRVEGEPPRFTRPSAAATAPSPRAAARPVRTRATLRWRVAVVAVVAIAAVAFGLSQLLGGGIAATARTGANVRSGPGVGFGIVGSLSAGQHVELRCSSGGWLKLSKPYEGRYVARSLMRYDEEPDPC